MISCQEAVKQLWKYLDGAVSESDKAAMEEHLNFCRTCCGEVEFAQELKGFLADPDADEMPADVKERFTRTLDQL